MLACHVRARVYSGISPIKTNSFIGLSSFGDYRGTKGRGFVCIVVYGFRAAALHLNTRHHQNVRSFDTDSVLSDFLLLFITCRCPIYQTSVDTVCGGWWRHESAVAAVNPCSVSVPVQYQ